jgi:hypothetical protein
LTGKVIELRNATAVNNDFSVEYFTARGNKKAFLLSLPASFLLYLDEVGLCCVGRTLDIRTK